MVESEFQASSPQRCLTVHMCVCVCQTHFLASEHQHAASQREQEEVVAPTQLKGLWPPCQHNLFSTSGPPSLAASPFPSLPLASPPTRVYFCQLPYSCLHSVFAHTHKTFLVRADEALLLTVGTPGKMVNRHTSFCRQAPQLYSGPGDTSESDLPLILILYREDQWAC